MGLNWLTMTIMINCDDNDDELWWQWWQWFDDNDDANDNWNDEIPRKTWASGSIGWRWLASTPTSPLPSYDDDDDEDDDDYEDEDYDDDTMKIQGTLIPKQLLHPRQFGAG